MHVYVHVPFCALRCSYCDFAIAVRKETPDRDFLAALAVEWRQRLALPIWELSPDISTLISVAGRPRA